MSARNFPDWIEAYLEYSSFSEAPKRMRFWCGVSALAGALRRRVWIDQAYFQWTPNFFIILVAPPGIVSKSTTAGVAMDLLRAVPGIKFGPDVCTWQSLVKSLSEAQEQFTINGYDPITAAEITIESGEFGNLINPHDREMVDLLVTLWDGRKLFSKTTKMSGSETIEHPWINIVACTTPAWIAGNIPEYMIGGGFASRCVFVYCEQKEKYVAYPGLHVPTDLHRVKQKLIQDLEHISITLAGGYRLLPSAVDWGRKWYELHYKQKPIELDDDRFGGYIARKQTHLHKLAIIIAAAQRDDLIITEEDLVAANSMVTDLERDMPLVFSKIGKNEQSVQVDRLLGLVRRQGAISYEEAYRFLHSHFPGKTDMEGIVAGAVQAGLLELTQIGNRFLLRVKPERTNAQ